MIYRIDFVPEVSKTIAKYKKSYQRVYKKLVKILMDISEHPKMSCACYQQGTSVVEYKVTY